MYLQFENGNMVLGSFCMFGEWHTKSAHGSSFSWMWAFMVVVFARSGNLLYLFPNEATCYRPRMR